MLWNLLISDKYAFNFYVETNFENRDVKDLSITNIDNYNKSKNDKKQNSKYTLKIYN